GEATDGDALGPLERLGEEAVGALAALVGAEEVGLLDVEEVDGLGGDDLLELERARPRRLHRLELLVGELDVLIASVLVAADRVGALHDDVLDGAEELLLQTASARLVEHV